MFRARGRKDFTALLGNKTRYKFKQLLRLMPSDEWAGMKRKRLYPEAVKEAGPKSLVTERNMCLRGPVALD